jgi:hypothetical protein
MTPKEKAIELVEKMFSLSTTNAFPAKQCALIEVDELYRIALWSLENDIEDDSKQYWNLVKQEINKL